MTIKLGIFVGEDNWTFFNEIYQDLAANYQVEVFKKRTFQTPLLHGRLNMWAFRYGIQSILNRNDVCFFEWASAFLSYASHMPKHCKIVTRLHRFEMYEWVDKINWEVVDKIILVSQAKKNEFIAKFPDQAAKIKVISPSIPLKNFNFYEKNFEGNIGVLCHLTPRKRIYDLLLTFYELSKVSDHLSLHIAGGVEKNHQDYFYALNQLVKKLGLSNKVKFYGNVIETWKWYQMIDIFISNSYSEGLQVAPMEAMASGCYCLAHHWDGAEELLPAENLFFTSSELQHLIHNYCDLDEEQMKRQRHFMRKIAEEKFDIKYTIREIQEVIVELNTTTP
jgi:glycosyltransferase involved in cell wall biosynthesis